VTGRYDNAGFPVNAAGRDTVAGINRYNCSSRLLGEIPRNFRDCFPNFVDGTAHCLLLMLRIPFRVQASHSHT
jgi:hypothetical protein